MTSDTTAAIRPSDIEEGRTNKKRKGILRWLIPLLPAFVLLVLFFAGPVLWSIYTAFTNESLTGAGAGSTKFIGFQNFDRMLHDSAFHQSLVLTVVFVVGSAVIGQNTLGLALALLMKGRSRVVTSIVSTIVVAAWVMPEIVAAFCWYAFLNRDGSLNTWFSGIGVNQDWLYTTPMLAVILANAWRGTAFSMMVYSAAIKEIPPELTEAAEIDGASGTKRLWYVTIPLIRRSIATNLMLITLQTLAVFTTIYVMTGGGPGNKSQTTPIYMYEQAFKFYDLGYGTAMAVVLLLVGALFSLVYIKIAKVEA